MAAQEIVLDGVRYVPSKVAALSAGIVPDYITKLARNGFVHGVRKDGIWYVEEESLRGFLKLHTERKKEVFRKQAEDRKLELRSSEMRAIEDRIETTPAMRVAPTVLRRMTREHHTKRAAMRKGIAVASIGTLLFAGSLGLAFSGAVPALHPSNIVAAASSAGDSVIASIARTMYFTFCPLFRDCPQAPQQFAAAPVTPQEPARIAVQEPVRTIPMPKPAAPTPVPVQTVINQPVIERVVNEVRTVISGGISEALLNSRLNALNQNLMSRMDSLSLASTYHTDTVYNTVAAALQVDNLNDIHVTDSHWTGGFITDASISGGTISGVTIGVGNLSGVVGIGNGGTGTSSAPSYGKVLLGNAAGAYDLVATSSLGISGVSTFLALSDTPDSLVTGDMLYADAADSLGRLGIGSNGQVLKISGGLPVWGTDNTGSGGGSSAWATTSNDLAVYPVDTADVILVGTSATSTTGNILEVNGSSLFRNNVVAYGLLTAPRFTATSSVASVFPYASTTMVTATTASTTNLFISGIAGSLLKTGANGQVAAAVAGTDYISSVTGDWTGTFDGLEGSTYLANSFSTTSADYWKTLSTFFSTTSNDYWKTQTNFFSTTSTDYWKSVTDLFSTTSSNYLLSTYDKGFFFSTTSADAWKLTRDFFATTSADFYVNSSTTIPKTYAANTFTALQTFGNASSTLFSSTYASSTNALFGNLSVGSLTGLLKATNGVVSTATAGTDYLTSATTFAYPFTSLNSFGTSTAATTTSILTQGVFFASSTVAASQFPYASSTALTAGNLFATDITATNATTTSLAVTNLANGSLLKVTTGGAVTAATAGTDYVSSVTGDWTGTFDGLEGSTYIANSFSTTSADVWKLNRNFFSTTSTDYWKSVTDLFSTTSASYFLSQNQGAGFSTTSAIFFSDASTTIPKTYTTNTFTGLQTFSNASSTLFSSVYASTTNLIAGSATIGSLNLGAALTVPNGGTGSTTLSGILKGNGTGAIQTAVAGVDYLNSTSGDWTGTFDGLEGSVYLANSFSTTSADVWKLNRSFFATTSADYWETQQTARSADDLTNNSIEDLNDVAAMTEDYGDLFAWNGSTWTDFATSSLGLLTTNVAEGSNQYYTDARVQTYLGTVDKGFFFSTTSADVWKLNRDFFSTTSTDYWKSVTDLFSTTSAIYFTNASTTIPKTYTANTFTALQTFSNASSTLFSSSYASSTSLFAGDFTLGTLNGLLKSTNGLVSAATAGTDYLTSSTIFAYPFTSLNSFGTSTAATTTSILTQGVFFASSTVAASQFPYASSTALSVSGNSFLGTVTSGIWNGTAIGAAFGGTGQTTYTAGDILYASADATLSRVASTTSGTVLALVNGIPTWTATTTFSSGLTYANGNVTADLGNSISVGELSSADFGDWTCNGSACSLDADTVSDSEIDYSAVTLADFTNDAGFATFGYPFPSNATSTTLTFSSGLLSLASTTIGDGTQVGGLTISGGATTTGNAYFADQVSGAVGSASTPTFAFTGSLTTGVYSDTSDSLSIAAGGNQMFVVRNGSIYAKGLNPYLDSTYDLGTAGAYWNDAYIRGINVNTSLDLAGSGQIALGSGGGTANVFLNGATNGNSYFKSGGNVGIGTTSPYARLSVEGSSVLGNSALAGYFIATTSTASIFPYASTTAITATTASTTNLIVSSAGGSTGCAQFSVTGLISNTGSACGTGGGTFSFTPTLNFGANTNATSTALSLFGGLNASSTVRFGNAGVSGFLFDSTAGNLGLGTTTPGTLLSLGSTGANTINISATATSTFGSGINVATGCFAVNGTCVGNVTNPSGGGQLLAMYSTSTVGTTTVNFNGASGSAPSFSAAALTLPSNTSYYVVEVWGGGGGGGAVATNNGAQGATTCFSNNAIACVSVVLQATGGGGGAAGDSTGGAGGSGSSGDVNMSGGGGGGGGNNYSPGGLGGSAPSGGGGGKTFGNLAGVDGSNGAAFGGGGSGGFSGSTAAAGGGGGGYSQKLISNTTAATFTVGAGGAGGAAGTQAGGKGGDGGVIISVYTTGISNGSLGSGTAGQFAFYNAAGTNLSATSSLFVATSSFIGIGTTTPNSLLNVAGAAAKFTLTDTSGGTNLKHWFQQSTGGLFKIGTTSDSLVDTNTVPFSIAGTGFGTTTLSGLTIAGFATSTSNVGFNLSAGCYAILNTCLGGGSSLSGTLGQLAYFSGTNTAVGTSTLFIGTNSSVGIGTTTPTNKLTITDSAASQLSLSAGGGIAQWAFRNAGGNLYFSTTTVAGTATTSSSALTILSSNGYMGIGTSSPLAGLHVQTTDSQQFRITGTHPTGFTQMVYQGTGRTYQTGVGNASVSTLDVANKYYLYDGDAGIVRMVIDSAGNAGFGTTSPGSKLSVQGNIFLAGNITSTSTTASIFPFASTTGLTISGTASTTDLLVSSAGGSTGCAQFSVTGLISNTGTACGSGGAAYPFTPTSNFGSITSATGTALSLLGGLNASSTVRFGNAGVGGFLFDSSTGRLGLGTTSPWAQLSINPDGIGSGPAFAIGSSTATMFSVTRSGIGSIFNFGMNSTSTVPNNQSYAWTIATSSTANPLFRVDTTSGSEGIAFGVSGSDVVIGDVGAASNLIFEENSTIKGQGSGRTITIGANSDILNIGGSSLSVLDASGYPVIYAIATTTGTMDFARVGIGTTTSWGNAGLRDQLTVSGRIYSTWRQNICDFPGVSVTTAITGDTTNTATLAGEGICGIYRIDEDTDGNIPVATSNVPPFIQLEAGITTSPAAGEAEALLTSINVAAAAYNPVLEVHARTPGTIDAGSRIFMVGFMDTAFGSDMATEPANGYYFIATSTNTWRAVTRSSSVSTITTTSIATSTTNFAKLRIEASSSRVDFLIDGTVVASHTTNIASANMSVVMSAGITTGGSAGTAGNFRELDISVIRLWVDDPPEGTLTGQEIAEDIFDPVEGADIAEAYLAGGPPESFLEGMIVTNATSSPAGTIARSSLRYENDLMGVVSTSPHTVLGQEASTTVRIGIVGRVPVIVSLENGAIKKGDAITSSSITGIGMKAKRPGSVIGKTLETFDPNEEQGVCDEELETELMDAGVEAAESGCYGRILVVLDADFHMGIGEVVQDATESIETFMQAMEELANAAFTKGAELTKFVVGQVVAKVGIFERLFTKTLHAENVYTDTVNAKKLCLEEVCVTKAQLQALLEEAGLESAPPPPAPPESTPAPEPETQPESTPTEEETPPLEEPPAEEPLADLGATPPSSVEPEPQPEPTPTPTPAPEPEEETPPAEEPAPEPTPEPSPEPVPEIPADTP